MRPRRPARAAPAAQRSPRRPRRHPARGGDARRAPASRSIDLGAGVGAAGLAVARRIEGVAVTLVEIDPALAALARARMPRATRLPSACARSASTSRRRPPRSPRRGWRPVRADRVLMNPPFNAPQQQPSPDRGRRLAHSASRHTLDRWVGAAARLLRPAGVVTLIWRADALDSLLAALTAGFGAVTLLPIHPKPGAPAIRVLARAVKASRAPLSLLPGFVLADAGGKADRRKPRPCCAAARSCLWPGLKLRWLLSR